LLKIYFNTDYVAHVEIIDGLGQQFSQKEDTKRLKLIDWKKKWIFLYTRKFITVSFQRDNALNFILLLFLSLSLSLLFSSLSLLFNLFLLFHFCISSQLSSHWGRSAVYRSINTWFKEGVGIYLFHGFRLWIWRSNSSLSLS